jgi:hypothetical protein
MNDKEMVDIKGLDKAEVLVALWKKSYEVGLSYNPSGKPLTVREARRIIKGKYYSFDYCKGRVIKCNISGDEFDPWRYDRENGSGAAKRAIDELRKEIANRAEEKGTVGMMKHFLEFLNGSPVREERQSTSRGRRRR